jgi:ELWxxDGT repeat protein
MKKNLLFTIALVAISVFGLHAQGVTQIDNNHSLRGVAVLTSTKAIGASSIDSSIWTTDATKPGTVPIPTNIKYGGFGTVLSGKFIFDGYTPTTGSELYMTDGTSAGTVLVSDINPGAAGSSPRQMASLNDGFLYFTADDGVHGRELWRTNGTPGGTTLVKDIEPGPLGSLDGGTFSSSDLFSNGSYLLFAANTTGSGSELWKSDGTSAGTVLLKDINTGTDSSNPDNFYRFNNMALFTATDATHGNEIWKTDGTPGGTVLLKDINPGTGSSTNIEVIAGIPINFFLGFHSFNGRAYFQSNDGTSTGELWTTDGTTANTTLLKNIVPGTGASFVFAIDGVNLPNKFIFPVSDGAAGTRSELWESDGTPGGTVLFESFSPVVQGDIPTVFIPFVINYLNGTFTEPLFQGNKFFFTARTPTEGKELWISDGSTGGTHIVKDINPGINSGVDTTGASYLYTTTAFFFTGNDGTHGNELWQTDGTDAGTTMVDDIDPGAADSDPNDLVVFNNKIVFSATDGDNANARDLYTVFGNFVALPVKLTDFTVTLKTNDGLLQWSTAQKLNTKNFTIQRSFNAQNFEDIGIVQADATSSNSHAYSFTDVDIANSGKSIVYYRLLSTDIDGKSETSNVISIRLKGNNQWSVQLLSNPVHDNVHVLLSGISGNLQLTIKDINSRSVYTNSFQNVNGQITLPANLQHGTYLLIAENNNERKVIKFIK